MCGRMDHCLLCGGYGRQRDRITDIRAAVRSVRVQNPDRLDDGDRAICTPRVPRRILDVAAWSRNLGHRHGRPRVNHSRGRRAEVPIQRRASAFGLFTAGYGVSWFAGSALIGILYDFSVPGAIAFCIVAELAAVPIFIWVGRRYDMVVVATPKQRDESSSH